MSNNIFDNEKISPDDFIKLAGEAKIQLIDRLAASMMAIGEEYAVTAAEYYRQKYTKEENGFAELTRKHKLLEIRWDMIKHVVSALQSTLRAERGI